MRQLHGQQPDHQVRNIAASHGRGARRFNHEDYSRRSRRNSGAEEHHQRHGDQLSSFASEVTRVAREVGTEGKLGGQAEVKGVAGTWKDLTKA